MAGAGAGALGVVDGRHGAPYRRYRLGAVALGHSAGALSALVHHGFRPLADLEVALAAADLPGRGTRRRGGHGLPGSLETHGILAVGALHLAAFFLTALVCHGAMAADRPASKHLTEYYLWMSAGGVVGGLLCALVAPLVFNSVLEYPLMLVAACLLRPPPRPSRYERFWRWSDLVLMLVQGCVFAFAVFALWQGRLAGMAADWSSRVAEEIRPGRSPIRRRRSAGSLRRESWPSCCSAAACGSPSLWRRSCWSA